MKRLLYIKYTTYMFNTEITFRLNIKVLGR